MKKRLGTALFKKRNKFANYEKCADGIRKSTNSVNVGVYFRNMNGQRHNLMFKA